MSCYDRGMKHVLITGGSDGLGKITAQKLVKAGYKVTILANNVEKTEKVAMQIGSAFVVADVASADQVAAAMQQAVEQSGAIDILINNAGIWIIGKVEANSPTEIEQAFKINTLGTIYATHAVVPAMKSRQSGRIINVISQAGLLAKAERTIYNSTKWAITGFTKSLQMELKSSKVTVVGFYPGAMNTGLFAKANDDKDRSEALAPEQAADALVSLCNLPAEIDVPEFGIQNINY
jgi:NAD(P)-dependent dehydrogenase (short-subunit alcohol dehydrogenase family)